MKMNKNSDEYDELLEKINDEYDKFMEKLYSKYELNMKRLQASFRPLYDNDEKSKINLTLAIYNTEKASAEKLELLTRILKDEQKLSEEKIEAVQNILDNLKTGWTNGKYKIANSCLLNSPERQFCRSIKNYTDFRIAESYESSIKDILEIFFDEKYGKHTLVIFIYCLASVYTTRLNRNKIKPPFYLQIQCCKGTRVFNLIRHIVEICDINLGLREFCKKGYYPDCYYKSVPLYPTGDKASDIQKLLGLKDIPVIIDGTACKSPASYRTLLKDIANIPFYNKAEENTYHLKVLPIFVTDEITDDYHNVLNLYLQHLSIDEKYLEFINKKKGILGAFVYEFIRMQSVGFDTGNLKENIDDCKASVIHKYLYIDETDSLNMGMMTTLWFDFLDFIDRAREFIDGDDNEVSITNLIREAKVKGKEEIQKFQVMCSPNSERILSDISDEVSLELKQRARLIKDAFVSYKLYIKVIDVQLAKNYTIYIIEMLRSTKKDQIESILEDISIKLGISNAELHFNERTKYLELAVPKEEIESLPLFKAFESKQFMSSGAKVPYIMGTDINDDIVISDMDEMKHLLIGGSSNCGKSIAVHSLILSALKKCSKDEVRFLFIDLKGTTLCYYEKIEHLATPIVINDGDEALACLRELNKEMMNRYSKKINEHVDFESMPYIICLIEEFPKIESLLEKEDLKEFNRLLANLCSQARECKISMIIVAQDPKKDVLDSKSASNIIARLALTCVDNQQSRTLLGQGGAEKLHGKGDMLFKNSIGRIKRLQGVFVATEDISVFIEPYNTETPTYLFEVCNTVKDDNAEISREFLINRKDISEISAENVDTETILNQRDREIISNTIYKILYNKDAFQQGLSKNGLMKSFNIGHSMASRYMLYLENLGIVGGQQKNKPRVILVGRYTELDDKAKKIYHEFENRID